MFKFSHINKTLPVLFAGLVASTFMTNAAEAQNNIIVNKSKFKPAVTGARITPQNAFACVTGRLSVFVKEEGSNDAIPATTVVVTDSKGQVTRKHTGRSNRANFNLCMGRYNVSIAQNGQFIDVAGELFEREPAKTVHITSSDTYTQEIKLDPHMLTLSGRVHDARNRNVGVSNVRIEVGDEYVRTNREGRYSLEVPCCKRPIVVSASHSRYEFPVSSQRRALNPRANPVANFTAVRERSEASVPLALITAQANNMLQNAAMRMHRRSGSISLPEMGVNKNFTVPWWRKVWGGFGVKFQAKSINLQSVSTSVENTNLKLDIDFEGQGREFMGEGRIPGVGFVDNLMPDAHWKRPGIEYSLPVQVRNNRIAFGNGRATMNGHIELQGACNWRGFDVCEWLGGYRGTIKNAVEGGIASAVNDIKPRLAQTINQQIMNGLRLSNNMDVRMRLEGSNIKVSWMPPLVMS